MSQRKPEQPIPTERFERVIAFAADEADGLGHAAIDNRHLLFALSAESKGLARAVLERFNITSAAIHELLAEPSVLHDRVEGQLELASEVRATIQRAGEIAEEWQHRTLDTEHLLYAAVVTPSSLDELLNSLNVKPPEILSALAEVQAAAPQQSVREEAAHAYRLTLESAWVLSSAAQLARESGSVQVDARHVLVALMQRDSSLASLFSNVFHLEIEQLGELLLAPGRALATIQSIGLSDEAQVIIGYAVGEAWNRRHQSVRPIHIALGLARATGNSALNLLSSLGVSQAALLDELATRIHAYQ